MASSNDGTATTTYTYDGNDDRVSKTTGSDTTVYPSMYYSVSGATSTKYIYAGNELVAYIEGNGTATSTYHVLTDHLGGTNVVTDENGNVTQSKDYYPFGSERVATGTADLAKGYIGQYHDPEWRNGVSHHL